MGWNFYPVYGKDLGSAIECAKNIIAKIETNKFDKNDLKKLDGVLAEIREVLSKDEKL